MYEPEFIQLAYELNEKITLITKPRIARKIPYSTEFIEAPMIKAKATIKTVMLRKSMTVLRLFCAIWVYSITKTLF